MNNSEILGEEAAVRQIVEDDFSATNGHFEDDSVTNLRGGAFRSKTTLKSISLPNVANVINYSSEHFSGCTNLETAILPNLTRISANMFNGCSKLEAVELPKVVGAAYMNANFCFMGCEKLERIALPSYTAGAGSSVFRRCSILRIADLGGWNNFQNEFFRDCPSLIALILRKNAVVTLGNISTFNGTKYATNGAGGAYVYVPRDLISSYQAATNWATLYAAHSDMFRALQDYTVDGTTTGDFDESLI